MSEERSGAATERRTGEVRISKVVAHISIGDDWKKLQRAHKLLESLTGQTPVYREAKNTVKAFNITQGDPIATLVTLRGKKARDFLDDAIDAVNYEINRKSIDNNGNFAFGIEEHIELPGVSYDPKIGIFGMDVMVNLEKEGARVKRRKYKRSDTGEGARVTPQEAVKFMERELGVEVT